MQTDMERRVVSAIRWRILPLLVAGYFFAYLDRVNIGYAAITMNAQIGLTATSFGFVAGIFFIGYVLFEIPSNLILERVGARRWLARIMITWGLVSAGTAFVWSPESLGVARFLLGLAEAGYFPGLVFFLMAWLPNAYRARFIGSLIAVAVLSVVIGGPISGAIMSIGTVWGLKNWQWLYILEGLPTVFIGLAILVWLPNSPREVAWLGAGEKAWLAAKLEEEHVVKESVRSYTLREVLTSPVMWMIGAAIFPIGAATYSVLAWLPQVVKEFGLSNVQTGFVSSIPFLVTAVAMMWWSARSDRLSERPWHIFLPSMMTAVGLVVVAYSPAGLVSLVGITFTVVGLFSSLTILFTLAPSYLTGVAAAAGTAMVTAVGNIGSFAGPYMVGWIRDATGSHQNSLLVFAVLMAGTGVIGLTFKPPTDRKYEGRVSAGTPSVLAEPQTSASL